MTTILISTTIVTETCCKCGVVFGINKQFKDNLLENGKSFFCTNGHSQFYSKKKNLEQQLVDKNEEIKQLNALKCRIEICNSDSLYLFIDWKFESRFKKGGVNTIGDALELGERGLRKIYGVGDKCIESINSGLYPYNVRLKP